MIRCPHKLNVRLSEAQQEWLLETLRIFRGRRGQDKTKTDLVLQALQQVRDELFSLERKYLDPPTMATISKAKPKKEDNAEEIPFESNGAVTPIVKNPRPMGKSDMQKRSEKSRKQKERRAKKRQASNG